MAFVYALDPTAPANTDLVKDGAGDMRLIKNALIERVESWFQDVDNDPWQAKAGVTFLGNFNQSAGTAALQAVTGTTLTTTSHVSAGAAANIRWTGRSILSSPADSQVLLTDTAGTDFARLMFGGTTASYPAVKRSSTALHIRLADDSGFAAVQMAGLTATTGTFSSTVTYSGLTASQAVFTDGSKGLVSNAITGSGNVVMSASPTLTGTVTTAAISATTLATSGTITTTGAGNINGLLVAGGTTNNAAYVAFKGGATTYWYTGLNVAASNQHYDIYDVVNAALAMSITAGAAPAVAFNGALSGITTLAAVTPTFTGVATAQNMIANAGVQAHAANRAVLSYNASLSNLTSYGADASTVGAWQMAHRSSNGSLGSTSLTISYVSDTAYTYALLGAVSGITTLAGTGAVSGFTSANFSTTGTFGTGLTVTAGTSALQAVTSTTLAATGLISSTVGLAIAATQKLNFDGVAGSGNTYMHESAGDTLLTYVGGFNIVNLDVSSGTGAVSASFLAGFVGYAADTPNSKYSAYVGGVVLGTASMPNTSYLTQIKNGTAPAVNPTAGNVQYAESGAYKARGSSGTVTTIAPA